MPGKSSKYYDDEDIEDAYEDYYEEDYEEDQEYYRQQQELENKRQQELQLKQKQQQQQQQLQQKMQQLNLQKNKERQTTHARSIKDYQLEPRIQKLIQQQQQQSQDSKGSGAKQKLHLVVLGHVDAGKSTLMGRLMFQLDAINQQQKKLIGIKTPTSLSRNNSNENIIDNDSNSKQQWAWLLDQRQEERDRGITVDVSFQRFQTKKFKVTLLDAPGHLDFVPNAFTGASLADCAILVVDGSIGGFEAGFGAIQDQQQQFQQGIGQTKEHAQIIRCLGVEQILIVVTKLDTCQNPQERYNFVKDQVLEYLNKIQFKNENLQIIPCIATQGENIFEAPKGEILNWFKGNNLIQAIDQFEVGARNLTFPLRISVANIDIQAGNKIIANGKVICGVLVAKQQLYVVPPQLEASVQSFKVDGEASQLAQAGDDIEIIISNIKDQQIYQGCILTHLEYPCQKSIKIIANILVLETANPIMIGQDIIMHIHQVKEAGQLSQFLSLLDLDQKSQVKSKPKILRHGQWAKVEISLERAIAYDYYDTCQQLSRFSLRQQQQTIAIGFIQNPEV